MKSGFKVLACLCLSIAAVVAVATASQLVRLSPEDLGRYSGLVFRGKVLSADSYWNDGHTKIFTRVLVGADETYKGEHRAVVELVQLGGTVGNVKVTVQGALQWTPGEEVLLFAEPYDFTNYQVLGLSQGKFAVKRDKRTGAAYIEVPPEESGTLLGAPPVEGQAPAQAMERVPLERFVNQALGRR
jgi:hypothetical protein